MNRRQKIRLGLSLLLGIGLLALVVWGLHAARFPYNGWTPLGEACARLTMTWNWLRMPRNGDHLTEEEALLKVYRAASEVTGGSDQAVVLSAEKVLYQEAFRDSILLKFLMTIAYVRANTFWHSRDGYQKVLQKHGSAYEILVIPPDRAAEVSTFSWWIPERGAFGFPFMWAKRPDLYQGIRPSRDVRGGAAQMKDWEFTAYLQAATNWFNGSRTLAEIDPMLVPTGDEATIFNGLTLLRRHPDREAAFERLALLATSPKPRISSRVIWELAEFKNERAVEAIARTLALGSGSRWAVIRALGQTGHPAAVKHLEEMVRAPVPKQTSNDSYRRFLLDIISALAKIPSPEARELLSELAADKDSSVSAAAKTALAGAPIK